jgi:cytochrome c peroxidase
MRAHRIAGKITVVLSTSLALMVASVLWLSGGERARGTDQTPVGIGDADILRAAYVRWARSYAQAGGARHLVLGLTHVKGLSTQFSRASGWVAIDLAAGSLAAQVSGLPRDSAYDLWLIDERSDPGAATRPRSGDVTIRVGSLVHEEGAAARTARLSLAAPAGFELDLVAVAPAGRTPSEAGVLFGAPILFQRMYHDAQAAALALRPAVGGAGPSLDAAPPSRFAFLVPRPAYAGVPGSLESLIADGERLFFEEKFAGNGRTCGTCHPAENNFTIDPTFISTLGKKNPLFVAEFNPALQDLEVPELMRGLGLILENLDGFDQPGVMRGVPHTLAMSTSLTPAPQGVDGSGDGVPPFQRTGWSGDGAPNGGTLRDFATGAVTQHFTRTLARVPGTDFRLPTSHELDALEAFQLSLGRAEDPDVSALTMRGAIAERGRELFLQETTANGSVPAARCHSCHSNGGANVSPLFLSSNGLPPGAFNFNLDIGVQNIDEQLATLVDAAHNPPDQGLGIAPHPSGGFGNGTFNVPPLIEAADTGPFFHNNAILTLEGVLAFYLGGEFVNSPAVNQFLNNVDNPPGFGVLTAGDSQLAAVAAFLRVMNAIENVRSAIAYLQRLPIKRVASQKRTYKAAVAELEDAKEVLEDASLHPEALPRLRNAIRYATNSEGVNRYALNKAIAEAEAARGLLVVE